MKMLGTDYDGTLRYATEVMEEDIEAIRKWREAGNLFAIVTGRSGESIRKEMNKYGLECDYLVCNNGGLVFKGDESLYENYMETLAAVDIIYALKEFDSVVSITAHDGMHRHKIEVHPDLEDHRFGHLRPDLPEEEVLSLPQYCQIVASCTDDEAARELADMINQFFHEQLAAYPNNTCVDIVARDVNKGEGLIFAAAYAGLDEEDVYAVGDSYNDMPMIEAVPNSAVMSVAPETLQEQAMMVCDSLHEVIESLLK